jgi:hypothetical protein
MRILKIAGLFLLLVLFQVGCIATLPKSEIPKGFALYPDKNVFKAVSPDGVMYRIRTEKNDPFADLPFWKKAIKKRMMDAGYNFVDESEIDTQNRQGYLIELTAPLGNKDYSYLIAIFLGEQKEIVIVESCGEIGRFILKRDDIIAAIKEIRYAD